MEPPAPVGRSRRQGRKESSPSGVKSFGFRIFPAEDKKLFLLGVLRALSEAGGSFFISTLHLHEPQKKLHPVQAYLAGKVVKSIVNRPLPLVAQGARFAKETILESREKAAFQKIASSLSGAKNHRRQA